MDENSVGKNFQKIGTNVTFKNAINGFSKEDVIYYVDKLQKDFAGQKKTIVDELERLYSENNSLNERITKYESTIEELAKRLKYEYSKPDLIREQHDKYESELNSAKAAMFELQKELNIQREHADELSRNLKQAVVNTNSAREQAKALSEKLYAANTEINQARQRLAAELDRANKLQQAVEYFKSQSEMYASRAAGIGELQQENRGLMDSMQQLREQFNAADYDNFQLREQIKSLNARLLERQRQQQYQPMYNAPRGAYDPASQYGYAPQYAPRPQQYGQYQPQPQYQAYRPQPFAQPAAQRPQQYQEYDQRNAQFYAPYRNASGYYGR